MLVKQRQHNISVGLFEVGAARGMAPSEARAHYWGRGGSSADESMDLSAIGVDGIDLLASNTTSSPRHVHFPSGRSDNRSGTNSTVHSLTSASTLSTLDSKLDLSPTDALARQGVLRETVFDDATNFERETPEEMQKKDPLGTQIWKLYHKQRGQLPNGERLENLTWRMMSMNLRRKELERRG